MGLVCSKKSKYTAAGDDEFEHIQGSEPMSAEDRYLKAEFEAMDADNDGMLTTSEFVKLLQFLGYADPSATNAILQRANKDENAFVTIDEYFSAMKDNKDVLKGTNCMRDVFKMFDKDSDGSAKKKDVYKGFEDMGVELDKEMKEEIDKMDLDKDGKIKYQEFLKAQLKKKEYIK